MYSRKIPLPLHCGLHLTREVLNGKWKPILLSVISEGIKRPSEIQKVVPDATKRVLNLQLRELEDHGIVTKKVYHELPLKVEYSLTPLGETLMPVIDAMNHWGDKHRSFLEPVIEQSEPDSMIAARRAACTYYQSVLQG
jgi:DNA-binding HxlR family transcriptional regulator